MVSLERALTEQSPTQLLSGPGRVDIGGSPHIRDAWPSASRAGCHHPIITPAAQNQPNPDVCCHCRVYSRREIFCLMSVAGYRSALPSAVARFHHFIRSFSLGTRPRIRAFTTSRVSLAAMAELQQREELTGRLLDGKLIARYVAGCLDCFQMPGSL